MRSSKRLYWIVQISSWFLYALVSNLANFLDMSSEFSLKFSLMIFLFATTGFLITNGMRTIILRLNWLNLSLLKLLLRLFLLIISSAFLMVESEVVISILFQEQAFTYLYDSLFGLKFFTDMLGAVLLLVLWIGLYFTYHYFNKSYYQELDNLRLENSGNEIEMMNLKKQLNPHFLFNSLNSIRALITEDSSLAKEAITNLSALLRSFLITNKQDKIPLTEEIKIVKDYLALEKIRFENRLDVQINIEEDVKQLYVPPLILQTLVENAIKHGISQEINGGTIDINAISDKENYYLAVMNTGEITNHPSSTKVGHNNIRRRLSILYQGGASFEFYKKGDHIISEIIIKKNYG